MGQTSEVTYKEQMIAAVEREAEHINPEYDKPEALQFMKNKMIDLRYSRKVRDGKLIVEKTTFDLERDAENNWTVRVVR